MWDTEQEWREQLFFSPPPTAPRPDSLSYGNTTHFSQGHHSQYRNNSHPLLPSHVLFPGMVLISWGWSGPTNIRNCCQNRSLISLVLYFHVRKAQSYAGSSFPGDSLSSWALCSCLVDAQALPAQPLLLCAPNSHSKCRGWNHLHKSSDPEKCCSARAATRWGQGANHRIWVGRDLQDQVQPMP